MSRPAWSRIALAVVLLIAPAAVLADDTTAIAKLVANFHAEHRFSGSVLVARGDEVIYEAGFGEADRAWHVPNRPDTVFLVGSVSKQFTSMLVLQLAAEGKLGLEDPIGNYLPDYPADKSGITIHQLLCHASGLPHYGGFEEIDVDLGDYLRLDRPVSSYVELIGKLNLQSEPGTEYSYSSMGYIVLAYIAETITGKGYGELIRERIAGPLDIEDLGFAYDDEVVEKLAEGYVYEMQDDGEGGLELAYTPEPYRDQSNKYSTGGVHASVRALYRWARAIVSDELLDESYRERMFTPQIDDYGYGWRIDPGDSVGLPEDVEVISHGGSLSGYRANIMILDRGRYTLVALGNSSTSRSPGVTQAIARLLHGEEPGEVNILGTAVAWRMVRDGEEAAVEFFRKQQAAGFPDYFNNDFAFYAYADGFADLERPDLGLALTRLGLEAHPDSAMLQLGLAVNHHAMGDSEAVRATAQKAREIVAEDGGPDFVEEDAKELLDELDELAAEELPMAVGEG